MARLTFALLLVTYTAVFLELETVKATPPYARECVMAHNHFRSMHGAGDLQWDEGLAEKAQKWAEHLQRVDRMEHDPKHSTEHFGENLYQIWGQKPNCKDAVKMWYAEIKDYIRSGYCRKPPVQPTNNLWKVLHFTQVVWKGTRKVGVGIAGDFVVARYYPAGNMLSFGGFAKNVQC